MMVIRVAGSQWEMYQPLPVTLGKKGSHGGVIPDVSLSTLSSFVVQAGIVLHSWIIGEALLPVGLC